MRRSTAAGIYVLRLPQDAAARNSPVGICRKRLRGGAVREEPSFPGIFSAFGTFGTGEGLLLYGIYIRC